MNHPVSSPCRWRPVRGLALLPLLLGAGIAGAQTAPAAPATRPAEAAKADADSAAAMERARRLADNPMRLILEASRGRARGVVAVPVAEPAAVAVASAGAAAPSAGATVPPAVAPAVLAAPAPAPVVQQLRSELAAAPAPSADSATPSQITPTALPAASAVPALPTLPSSPPVPRLEVNLPPQLLRMVEPEIPQRVLDQAGGPRDVTVEFTIRADGSVADVALLPPASRLLLRFVSDALAQWRYAPLPEPRRMRVQLVFSGS